MRLVLQKINIYNTYNPFLVDFICRYVILLEQEIDYLKNMFYKNAIEIATIEIALLE